MKPSSRPRASSKLSDSVHHQLSMYALAASAAGVGVVALSQPADAKIIYTPTHARITPNHTIPVDLNHDGKIDFNIKDTWFSTTTVDEDIIGSIAVIPARKANRIAGYAHSFHKRASALPAGVRIGPKSPFSSGSKVMVSGAIDIGTTTVGYCGGPWKNVQHRYLGLKFTIQGKIHYGWARLNETCAKNGENTALLTGYAYETIPNKPIIAGKEHGEDDATLGGLALGSAWPSGK
jgi:hypothetical protein